MSDTPTNTEAPAKRLGLLAQFAGPDELVEAAEKATEAGYKRVEAYSPFPVLGIDDALNNGKTILPYIVLVMGLTGLFVGLTMQCYMNGVEGTWWLSGYDFLISGKPSFSIPAFIPVTFEVIILLSAFGSFFGMIILNQLPKLSNPLFRSERFATATDDGFFLFVEADDPKVRRDRDRRLPRVDRRHGDRGNRGADDRPRSPRLLVSGGRHRGDCRAAAAALYLGDLEHHDHDPAHLVLQRHGEPVEGQNTNRFRPVRRRSRHAGGRAGHHCSRSA